MNAATRFGLLRKATTAFFYCDVQEKSLIHIPEKASIIWVSNYLLKAAEIMKCKVICTEHYPQGLGPSVKEIPLPPSTRVFPKSQCSMLIPEVLAELNHLSGIKDVVLFGIETQVCLLQTTMDLVERGIAVHLATDAIASIRPAERLMAFETMKQVGGILSTSESIIFRMIEDAKDEHFGAISALTKGERPDPMLFRYVNRPPPPAAPQ